ncbi:MAG: molybdate ABC transporter substrate-binding protein [Verrucomicrobiota bacterium]|nr:molybdate ABC transporter substrate-binding protein [Verrucomicrobiota bacterium]
MESRTAAWGLGLAVLGLTARVVSGGGEAAPAGEAKKLSGSIFVYCAAGVKDPIVAIAQAFTAETRVTVEMSFANSGQLLGQIETTKKGDVYIPGDIGFAAKAQEKKLTAGEPRPFCYFVPAIYARKGNPKGIKDLADLARPGLKLALADPSAAVGQLQAQVFKKNRLDEDALKRNTVTSPATVTDVALAVKLGAADAGIIWDALGNFAPDEAELVRIPPEKNVISTVSACALAGSKNPEMGKAFVDYLGLDKAKGILKARGFTVDKPAAAGPIMVHVGGTMRPAMEEICKIFEEETGVKTEINYNDSGALMSVIQTTGKGDVCVLHDPFPGSMEKKRLVDRHYAVATLTLVIAVKKGNPKKIDGVKDLARDDVEVALTDAVYSTAGHIVDVVFKKAGIADAMAKKQIVRPRAGGEAANAVKIGTVDAAIVWNAVVFARRDALDSVPIDPVVMPDAKADAITTASYGPIDMSCVKVALMTLKGSKNPNAARKLGELAASERGKAIWAKFGFSLAPAGQ